MPEKVRLPIAHPAIAVDPTAISDAEAMGRTVAHIGIDGWCQCLCEACNTSDQCTCPDCGCNGRHDAPYSAVPDPTEETK